HRHDQHVAAGDGARDVVGVRHRDLGREAKRRHRTGAVSIAREQWRRGAIDLPQRDIVTVPHSDRGEHTPPRAAAQDGDAHDYVPATRTRLRPAFLAANSARSAAASTSDGSAPSSGNEATPSEMVSLPLGCVLPNSNGNSATWAQIRSATSLAAALPTSSRMMANSSPP